MASRIVTELLLAAARPIVATIRKGKPLATVFGAFVGGALATSSGLVVMIELVPFFVVVGAIMGATLTAALFKRPSSIPGAREADLKPFRLGALLQIASGRFCSFHPCWYDGRVEKWFGLGRASR